ncbi:MAG: hypothetical protein CVV06_01405 [Gammaproteobacteria bacterium HGW-Gammaproteobacteria-10]|nr:MAG: hypothetical protein CVV06_01405 [Gammaproteobacteria bacterium HGW-Gammaproteobacteria-10]
MKPNKFERGLIREFQDLERYFEGRAKYRPSCNRIRRLTRAAGNHYRENWRDFPLKRRVHCFEHRLHEGGFIVVKYCVSSWGRVRIVPPMKYPLTRRNLLGLD